MDKKKRIFFINNNNEKEYVDITLDDKDIIMDNKYSKKYPTLDSFINNIGDTVLTNSFEYIDNVEGIYDELRNIVVVRDHRDSISTTFNLHIDNIDDINELTKLCINMVSEVDSYITGQMLIEHSGTYKNIEPEDFTNNSVVLTFDSKNFIVENSRMIDKSYTSSPLYTINYDESNNRHVMNIPEYIIKNFDSNNRKVFFVVFSGSLSNFNSCFTINDTYTGLFANLPNIYFNKIYLAEIVSKVDNTIYFNFTEVGNSSDQKNIYEYFEPQYVGQDIITGKNIYRQIGIVPVVSGMTLDNVFRTKMSRIIKYNELYVVEASTADDVINVLNNEIYQGYNTYTLTTMLTIDDYGSLTFQKHGINDSNLFMYIDIEFVIK